MGVSIISFVFAIALAIYFPSSGEYAALTLVLVGTFSMIISAMMRERARNLRLVTDGSRTNSDVVEDEEELLNL
jgi:hypothetical protein